MSLWTRVAIALSLAVVLSIDLSAQQGRAPQAAGAQVMQAACTGCHELDTVTRAKKSAAQWETTVAAMVERGAPVIPVERAVLVDFLARNYGTAPASGTPSPALPQDSLNVVPGSDAHGRQLLQEVCSVCHELAFVYESRRSSTEWDELVSDMMGRGAAVLEGEREILLRFLPKYYGPESPKTNINSASSQQMVAAFGLSQGEADAVIRYKQQHGTILGWEDLRKIQGLDLKKFEAKRSQLSFF